MKNLLISMSLCVLFVIDVIGMNVDVFESLDAYRENNLILQLSEIEDYYQKAVKSTLQSIIDLNHKLTDDVGTCSEIKEGQEDQECTRSQIILCEERLFDLSIDGDLGQKIISDFGDKIEVKSFDDLMTEIKNGLE